MLKGGKTINLTIFNLPRLLVDIDLDFVPNPNKNDTMNVREEVTRLISIYVRTGVYAIRSSKIQPQLGCISFG